MSVEHERDSEPPWIVLKFGGTSVSTPERWRVIERILHDRVEAGKRLLVVCSALSGASNTLDALADTAERGDDPALLLDQLHRDYHGLGEALGIDGEGLIAGDLLELQRLVTGARLIEEASARLRARVMALGELMLTRLGVAWLRERGLDVTWWDARDLLEAEAPPPGASDEQRYLAATCDFEADEGLRRRLAQECAPIVVTPGFIARDSEGDTVLLGRGGSDTSAAYLAAHLQAERLEIWTDVPGMFTAHPHRVPRARLLRRLDYDEAQTLASMGASVLHPRCLGPVRARGIALHIRCTSRPDLEGTEVTATSAHEPMIKAVSARSNLVLFSMRRSARWQPVGFLADVTSCFKRRGLSIDLISSSPSHISVTLDPAATPLSDLLLAELVGDLEGFCRPEVKGRVASISLVGRRIRSAMRGLGGALSSLEERDMHLMAQAANDLSLTFVVDQDEADALLAALHRPLFEEVELPASTFGPTWIELMAPATSATPVGGDGSSSPTARPGLAATGEMNERRAT